MRKDPGLFPQRAGGGNKGAHVVNGTDLGRGCPVPTFLSIRAMQVREFMQLADIEDAALATG